jgi:Ca2+-binding RTX toxin-like protein
MPKSPNPKSNFGSPDDDELAANNFSSAANGNDHLVGGPSDEVLQGGAKNDHLSGGLGNDALVGGDGNDKLEGGAGNDLIIGRAGNDNLSGGTGINTFLFRAAFGKDVTLTLAPKTY